MANTYFYLQATPHIFATKRAQGMKKKTNIDLEKKLEEMLSEEDKKQLNESFENLQELKLSWAGKLFFAGVAGWLGATAVKGFKQGMSTPPPRLPIKIKGTPDQIKAIMDAIYGSKAFQSEISRPNATIESVIEKLKLRDLNKRNFERLTGKAWPI